MARSHSWTPIIAVSAFVVFVLTWIGLPSWCAISSFPWVMRRRVVIAGGALSMSSIEPLLVLDDLDRAV
jgi:hypothetical protein